MDYVDWVERVMAAVSQAWRAADGNTKLSGLQLPAILGALGQPDLIRQPDYERTKFAEAVRDALSDLDSLGLVKQDNGIFFKLTSEGNKYPAATLPSAWPQIMKIFIDCEQETLLRAVAEMGQEVCDDCVCARDLNGEQVFAYLKWPWDSDGIARCYALSQQLADMRLLNRRAYMGGHVDLIPTYLGIVRITRKVETEFVSLVRDLVREWETTNVDFKRELNLTRDKEKAEFIRDILGITNTKSSGRRFLVIGFDNDKHTFAQSVDKAITQERLEQILQAYCNPAPRIKYERVPWQNGEVGLIEAVREPGKVPYKVAKAVGDSNKIQPEGVYVRHGSHTEPPTEQEYHDLIDEAKRANELTLLGRAPESA